MQDFTLPGKVQSQTRVESVALVNRFLRGVYLWMTVGLLVTAAAAFYAVRSTTILDFIYSTQYGFIALIVAEIIVVIWLSARIQSMSPIVASGAFLLYSLLNGLTLSVLLLAYAFSDITNAFLVTAGMFAAMSIYGLTTKRDLSTWGSFLGMGLIGLVIAMVVNFFVGGTQMQLVISGVAVVLFTLLTAYDTRMLKQMGESAPHDDAVAIHRGTILGALRLYLDFINLFIHLVRIFGLSRD